MRRASIRWPPRSESDSRPPASTATCRTADRKRSRSTLRRNSLPCIFGATRSASTPRSPVPSYDRTAPHAVDSLPPAALRRRFVSMRGPLLSLVTLASVATAAGMAAQTPRLGAIDFPTSGAPAAQASFIRGVLLLHSFEYRDAAQAFREAQRIDPRFALAYWGEALTYTHPVWDEQDRTAARAVLQRLGPSAEARRGKAPTLREKEYLHAVEVLYGDGAKAARDTAYSKAMERLVAAFPTDREAQVLYGVSLLGLSQGVRDVPTYLRAAAIAQRVFRDNPNHPR